MATVLLTYPKMFLIPMGKIDSHHLYPDYNKKSFMAYGDFALDDPNNTTIFFELQHAEKETYSINGGCSIIPMGTKKPRIKYI